LSQYTPLGLLLAIKALSVGWVAKKWSLSKLPGVGAKIGLIHKKSSHLKEFGELCGMINGYYVSVKPDMSMNSVIRVEYIGTYKGLDLSLSRPNLQLKKNVIDFKTSNWKFNWTFKTIRAHKNMAGIISADHDLIQHIISFYNKWIFALDELIISDNDIYCRLRYGFYVYPYIPSSKLEPLVNELLVLAEKIDSALDKHNK
jgi:hypothetical protein